MYRSRHRPYFRSGEFTEPHDRWDAASLYPTEIMVEGSSTNVVTELERRTPQTGIRSSAPAPHHR